MMNSHLVRRILSIISMVPVVVFYMLFIGIVIWAVFESGSAAQFVLDSWGGMPYDHSNTLGYYLNTYALLAFIVLPSVMLAIGGSKVDEKIRVPIVRIVSLLSLAFSLLVILPSLVENIFYFNDLPSYSSVPIIILSYHGMLITLFIATVAGDSMILLSTLIKDVEPERGTLYMQVKQQ
jgi:hypothetical protein